MKETRGPDGGNDVSYNERHTAVFHNDSVGVQNSTSILAYIGHHPSACTFLSMLCVLFKYISYLNGISVILHYFFLCVDSLFCVTPSKTHSDMFPLHPVCVIIIIYSV